MIWMSNDTGTGQAETKEQKLSPSFLTIIMTRGQILSHATRIFNVNPIPKCAQIPRFSEGFNWGSPTARIFGVAKTE